MRMCGIVGIVHSDSARPVPPAVIRRMCEAIRHRGPDDEGAYVDRNVGLGMRRLSIIDLAGGRQPIFNEDRSKVDRKSTRLNSSHLVISYAVFCLKKKNYLRRDSITDAATPRRA